MSACDCGTYAKWGVKTQNEFLPPPSLSDGVGFLIFGFRAGSGSAENARNVRWRETRKNPAHRCGIFWWGGGIRTTEVETTDLQSAPFGTREIPHMELVNGVEPSTC